MSNQNGSIPYGEDGSMGPNEHARRQNQDDIAVP